jgi:predicted ATPase
MGEPIKKLTIEGFKSIRELKDFELRPLNVLIGANGAGKSNFVQFFRLLHEMVEQRLQKFVTIEGGPAALLYMGMKATPKFAAQLSFGNNGYHFSLVPGVGDRLVFADEAVSYAGKPRSIGSGHVEAKLKEKKDELGKQGGPYGIPHYVFDSVSSWVVYHFHDTGPTAGVRLAGGINDNDYLRSDASNLAAFLFRIHETNSESYEKIRRVVQLAAPFFDDFRLRPDPINPDLIRLEWSQKESDYRFQANQLSDGTLRFICLTAALLQPLLPPTMFFDEPELGMHPYAINLLADLFHQAATEYGGYPSSQVIVSTQSALLLNEFTPEDVVVVERVGGQSTFHRLSSTGLSEWLQDYSLGQLWQKNVLGGRPHREDAPQASIVSG